MELIIRNAVISPLIGGPLGTKEFALSQSGICRDRCTTAFSFAGFACWSSSFSLSWGYDGSKPMR